ncbi:hypothetical protein VCR17J2_900073 [Vibrio coralliirubri]|nr:hypothetical protein VCR17J2_900073 [Vibrio coralliirubri]
MRQILQLICLRTVRTLSDYAKTGLISKEIKIHGYSGGT